MTNDTKHNRMVKNEDFQRLSVAIAWLRFPLIMCVVMLHCYCTVPLAPGDHSVFLKLVYPFGLWLGESGVPSFFFISGFLFYISRKSYHERISSRVHTLLYPYFFWNTLFLVLYIILYLVGHPQDILGKSISEYGLIDYIRAYIDRGEYSQGNNGPILCTYWYVRNLFILCLLSPVWYYLNKYLNVLFVLLLFGWWLSLHHNALLAESILFFNFGAYFSIHDINPLQISRKWKITFLMIWGLFAIADYISHAIIPYIGAFYLHRISLVLNICTFLYFADMIVKGDKTKVNSFLVGSVFWVYALHDHLAIALRRFCVIHFSPYSDFIQVALYFATVLIVTCICLASYQIMKYFFPSLVNFATGSRTK